MAALSKNGKDITDSDIVKWANEQVKKGGKSSTMRSFKDPGLKDAKFFLDLLDSIKPGYVDYSLVYDGRNDEERRANGEPNQTLERFCNFELTRHSSRYLAKLAISIARKLG